VKPLASVQPCAALLLTRILIGCVVVAGNVDSGKSTLMGVLTNATLDDGRGSARALVLKHRHEQENGRTSAVTVEIMGYKDTGEQVR
jgi:GTPase